MATLDDFRRGKDALFATDPQSPLTPEQRASFRSLAYYPENPALVVTARLEPPDDEDEFTVPASTGDEATYRRAGVVRFTIDDHDVQLTLLTSPAQSSLFLPFRDATSGSETYPAGRYVEIHPSQGADHAVTVDFNLAYNPYYAYNDAWSCPLPPPENWLDVPVRAGERRYSGH